MHDYWKQNCNVSPIQESNIEWAYEMSRRYLDRQFESREELRGYSHKEIAEVLNESDHPLPPLTKDRVRHAILEYRLLQTPPQEDVKEYVNLSDGMNRVDFKDQHLRRLDKETNRLQQMKSMQDIAIYDALSFLKPVALPRGFHPPAEAETLPEADMLVNVSDIHFGEVVRPDRTRGVGGYDMNTAIARMEEFAVQCFRRFRLMSHVYRITTIHIMVNGDIFHNETMRPSAKMNAQTVLIDQQILAARMLECFILKLATFGPQVEVYFVPGNHGRNGEKGQEPLLNNGDVLVGKAVASFLKRRGEDVKKRVKVTVSEAIYYVFTAQGVGCVMDHGHMVRTLPAPNPANGMRRRYALVKDIEARTEGGPRIRYYFVAHFHQFGADETATGTIHRNGSVIGCGEYGFEMGLVSDASQSIYFINEDGVMEDIFCVNLDHIKMEDVRIDYLKELIDDDIADALGRYEAEKKAI